MKKLLVLALFATSLFASAKVKDIKITNNYNTGDDNVVKFYVRVDSNNKILKIFQVYPTEEGELKKEYYSPKQVQTEGAVLNKRAGKKVIIMQGDADPYTGGTLELSYMKSAFSKKRGTFTMEVVPTPNGFEAQKNGVKITSLCFVVQKKLGATVGINSIKTGKCN